MLNYTWHLCPKKRIFVFFKHKIMKHLNYLLAILAMMLCVSCLDQNTADKNPPKSIYDFTVKDITGHDVSLKNYEGKVLLIVNVASKCGFTPQYDGLEALYKKYKDQGLVILGFPCDQFKHQEPGTDEEIAEFCRLNHGVTFPLMKKIDVFGENAEPLYTYLTQQVPTEEVKGLKNKATMALVDSLSKAEGRGEGDIRWNFTKFLISKDGSVIKRFPPVATPEDLEPEIEAMLK